MKASPVVSVIVPAYNAEANVADALRSALSQTLREIEVIVVDDGSTDGTASVVRRVAEDDARVHLIRQENAGVAAARNAAISAARGDYVAPLDADDVWYPDKLAAQVARAERGGPEMGMVYSWWVRIDERGVIRGSSFPCRLEGDVPLPLFYVNFVGNASVPLYRRSAVERAGGYDAGLRARGAQGCEDWDLSLRVAAHNRTGVSPGHHTGYRQVPGSMSSLVGTMARSYYEVVAWVRESWRGVPEEVFRWSEANFASYLAAQSYAAGRFASAARWSCTALARDPSLALSPYTPTTLAKSALFAAAGERFYHAVRRDRPSPSYTMEEVEAEWVESEFYSPWRDSSKPYDRLRKRRWERVCATPISTRRPSRQTAGLVV